MPNALWKVFLVSYSQWGHHLPTARHYLLLPGCSRVTLCECWAGERSPASFLCWEGWGEQPKLQGWPLCFSCVLLSLKTNLFLIKLLEKEESKYRHPEHLFLLRKLYTVIWKWAGLYCQSLGRPDASSLNCNVHSGQKLSVFRSQPGRWMHGEKGKLSASASGTLRRLCNCTSSSRTRQPSTVRPRHNSARMNVWLWSVKDQ